MLRHPPSSAAATTSAALACSPMMAPPLSAGIWAMSAFWQNRQRKLHPTVAME